MTTKRGIFFLILLLLISTTSALEVRLSEPQNATTITTNTITFKCKAVQTGSEVLKNITLYIFPENAPTWRSSSKTANDDQLVEIQASIPLNGIYQWNCLAKNSNNQEFFAPQNRSFTLNININNPPVILPIPDQTKNSLNSWFIDFTQYESDQEDLGPNLDWSVSGFDASIIKIEVTDSDGDTITFSPLKYGTTTANFTLKDSGNKTDSQIVKITLSQSNTSQPNQNNPPIIKTTIPDQNVTGLDPWKLDLSEYESDQEDSGSNLKWSFTGIDTSILEVEITDINEDELTFIPKRTGSDSITLTLTDSKSASVSQNIKITINEATSTSESQESPSEPSESQGTSGESFEDLEPETKLVESYTPDEQEIILNADELLTFSISTIERATITWFLNEEDQGSNDIFFLNTNNLENNKTHQIKALVKKGSAEEEIIWTIIKDMENLEKAFEEIPEGTTKENKTLTTITGFFSIDKIGSKLKGITKSKITIIILIIVIAIILFLIVLFFIKKKKTLKPKRSYIYKDIQIPKEQKSVKDLTKPIVLKASKEEYPDINDVLKEKPKDQKPLFKI